MPRFLLQCLNPLQRLITFGCLSNRSNSYCILPLFMCVLLFVVCIAYPSKLWGLGLGSFSIEIGTCPSLILSQVNACWEPFGRKKYFKFLCSSVTFWASHKHSAPAVLLVHTWARNVLDPVLNGCTLPPIYGVPHSIKLGPFPGWPSESQ